MNRALRSTGHQQDIIDRLDLGDLSLANRRRKITRQRHQPTVAQNMGLIGKAPRELGCLDWEEIESQAISKGGFFEPCTICLNPHGRMKSVVTSCVHTFHESCLNATKAISNPPRCPLCRTVYTQTISKRGYQLARHHAASKIQALARSFLTRQKIMKNSKFQMPKHIRSLRSDYVSKTIRNYSESAISESRVIAKESDELISASETALAAAREIFSKINFGPVLLEPEFREAANRAKEMNDCPVCISAFGNKTISLLSCSHVLHETCRIQLEKFSLDQKCPVCRQNYTFVTTQMASLPQ